MIRALAIKELREIAWIVAIALAAYGCVVGLIISPAMVRGFGALPMFPTSMRPDIIYAADRLFPFVQGNFYSHYGVISFVLAAAVGFRQSLGENRHGTYCFLLHRPMERRALFLTRILVGLGLLLFVAALPVLVLGIWAATPGTHPSPFEWSMTFPSWKVWGALTIIYLATFLCGIRQARWRGSRLAPLVAIAIPMLFVCAFPLWLFVSLPVLIFTVAFLLTSNLWVIATRDFS